MTSVEYYKKDFPLHLLSIKTKSDEMNRVSIYNLTRSRSPKTMQNFFKIESKVQFLWCCFYTALIDQALHASQRELHHDFEKISGYPKFVGLLSSYGNNMNPALLLLISTEYLDVSDHNELQKDFKKLTEFFLEDYIDFFHNVFPQYTNKLQTEHEQVLVIKSIFETIGYFGKWKRVPKDMKEVKPDLKMYKLLIDTFNDCMEDKLLTYSITQEQ